MYTINEFCTLTGGEEIGCKTDGNVLCVETDKELTFRTNQTQGFLAAYSFTIVTEGWLTLQYNGKRLTLQKDQLYTYSPGLPVTILSASDDYRGICLIADENYTLEIPQVRKAIHSSYFSLVQLSEPRMQLSPDDSCRLQELMRLAIQYCSPTHTAVQSDSLRMLYALFLTDLTAVQERTIRQHRFSRRVEDVFLGFQHLLPKHFMEHRDVGFYAAELCISPRYLSRVVHSVSGRTVVDYVNRMLIAEAAYLLRQTSLSITQIANRLGFAEVTTFARFFRRMKGMNPREYRKMGD